MSFQFEPGEPCAAALGRISDEEIDGAIAMLTTESEPLDHRVHEARKHLKKLRAVFALARGCASGAVLRRATKTVRRAAHALAPLRGEAALVESFESLEAALPGQLAPEHRARIRALLEGRAPNGADDRSGVSAAAELLRALREHLSDGAFEGERWSALEPGFRRTYGRARKAYRRALDEPASEVLHTFRTPTKRHFYQVQMLEPIWPEVLRGYRKELNRLGDLLGDHHDLSLLGPVLEQRGLDAATLRALGVLADERSRALEKEVMALGGRVFAERPDAISRRFGAYFDREWPTPEGE